MQEGATAIRHVRNAQAHDVLGAPALDAPAGEAYFALGAHHAAERAQRRRLARTVGAEERGDRLLLEPEVDAVQHARLAVGGPQPTHFKERAQAGAPR